MDIDFSRFTKDIQDKIKAALEDINSLGKIDAAEVRAMKLDKKVAIELMKQLSGSPEFVGDGFFRIGNENTNLLTLDKIENDTIVPLNKKALEYYSENYPDKDIKDGYYKDGILFFLDSKGNFVKDDSDNYITENMIIEEPDKKMPDFMNENGTLNIKEFQNYLNNLPESDEEYTSLMNDIELASKESSYWSIEKFAGTQKQRFLEIYQALENHDLGQAAELMYSYFQEECKGFDENVLLKIRSGLERLTGAKWAGPALYNALSWMAENVDNLAGRDEKGIGYAQRFVVGLANVDKGLGDFIFSTEGLITMGAIAGGEALLAKASSKFAPYIGTAIHSYFGAEGTIMVADGVSKVATGETLDEVALGGQEIGHGLPLIIAPVVRTVEASVKIYENMSRIKAAKGLKELDDVLTDILTKPMTPEERLNYAHQAYLRRLEQTKAKNDLQSEKTGENKPDLFSNIFGKKTNEFNVKIDKEFKEVLSEVDDKRAYEIALYAVKEYIDAGESDFNISIIKSKATKFLKLYKTIQERVSSIDDIKVKTNLQNYIDEILLNYNVISLYYRIDMAKNIIESDYKPIPHSKKIEDISLFMVRKGYVDVNNHEKTVEFQEHHDFIADIYKIDKVDELIDNIVKNPKSKEANELYDKYLENENIPEVKIKELCQQINQDFGVKIILPSNLKNAEIALKFVYDELYKFKISAEKHGEKANFPSVINFLSVNIKFFEAGLNKRPKNAFYNPESNVVYIRGLNLESVQKFLQHELLHSNLNDVPKEFPASFDTKEITEILDDLLDAGLEQSDIMHCLRNPAEFIATLVDNNIQNYSPKLKTYLIKFGMPEWIQDMKLGSKKEPLSKARREIIKNNVLYLIKTNYNYGRDFGKIYFSNMQKESSIHLLKKHNENLITAENLLKECTTPTGGKDSILPECDRELIILCITDSKLSLEENVKRSEVFVRKLQLIKALGITIEGCNNISAFDYNVFNLLDNCNFTIKCDDIAVGKKLYSYLTNPKERMQNPEIKSLLNRFINKSEVTEKFANIFSRLIAVIKDTKGKETVVTIEDLFLSNKNEDFTEGQLQFFAKKGSKTLQELMVAETKQGNNGNIIVTGGEFEKVDHLEFSSINLGSTKQNIPSFTLTMKANSDYHKDIWKAIKYTFEQRLLKKGETIDGYDAWELVYTRDNVVRELRKPGWVGTALKNIVNSSTRIDRRMDNLNYLTSLLSDKMWNGTIFKSIHSRARFLERLVLQKDASKAHLLTVTNISAKLLKFQQIFEAHIKNAEIHKHISGHNPNTIIESLGVTIGFKDDGNCATIFD